MRKFKILVDVNSDLSYELRKRFDIEYLKAHITTPGGVERDGVLDWDFTNEGDFYTSLTIDKRFVLLDNNEWDIRDNHSIKVELDDEEDEEEIEETEEVEEIIEEEIESDDTIYDDENDITDDDDDMDDLSIITDEEEEE